MAVSVFMSGAVTGNANLMEKIKRLARDNSFQPETPQHLGLGLFGRYAPQLVAYYQAESEEAQASVRINV